MLVQLPFSPVTPQLLDLPRATRVLQDPHRPLNMILFAASHNLTFGYKRLEPLGTVLCTWTIASCASDTVLKHAANASRYVLPIQ